MTQTVTTGEGRAHVFIATDHCRARSLAPKRDAVRMIASGKIMTGFHMIRAVALGADLCDSAWGMMFAPGCIQSLRCNTNACPTGITTQKTALIKGLVVADKTERVFRFHQGAVESLPDLMDAMAVAGIRASTPDPIFLRTGDMRVKTFAGLCD